MKTQPGYANGPIYWTIENAAAAIQQQEEWPDASGRALFEQMLEAAKADELPVHHPETEIRTTPRGTLGFADLVTPAEVNTWLIGSGSTIQWNAVSSSSTESTLARAKLEAEACSIKHFVLIPAVPKEVPELLRKLPPFKSVQYEMECDGTGGESATTAETLILVFETIIARHHIDRFTVDEAAFILARATGDTWDNWRQRIVAAANDGTLSSYRCGSVAPRLQPMRLIESSLIEVYGDDLNQWVPTVAKRVTYRFPPKGRAASIGAPAPAMLELAEVLSRNVVDNQFDLFEQSKNDTLRFLVVVPGVGACRVPLLALEQFKAGADTVNVDDMEEHYHGAHSGPYTIKAHCLHVLEDDWNKFEAKFDAAVEKLEAMERAAHGDEQRWIAGRRLWRISEAVRHITSRPEFGVSCEAFLRRVASAIEGKRLVLRDVEHGEETTKFAFPEMLSDCHWTYAEDFNAWLESAGIRAPYRLPIEACTEIEQGQQHTTPGEQTKDATKQDQQRAATMGTTSDTPHLLQMPAVQPQAIAPKFSMPKGVLVKRHAHHWPSIVRDLKDASTNGLDKAKAAKRSWYEDLALEWAATKGKLTDDAPQADDLSNVMRNFGAPLPSRKHTLQG